MVQHPPSVLYVEDDENDAILLRLAFVRAGIAAALTVVPNGREALDYLWGVGRFQDRTGHPWPSLVLLDLNLPQLSGFQVLQQLRAAPQFATLPVVVFTSSTQESDRSRATELGANAYLVKPAQLDQLYALVSELKRRWLEPGRPAG